MAEKEPYRIECKLCGDTLELNADSLGARAARTDPYQQMKLHLRGHVMNPSKKMIASHVQASAWILDYLAFRPVTQKERWRKGLHQLVDHFIDEPRANYGRRSHS